MVAAPRPLRIAILGGGCGAVSAAFWLTSTSQLRRKFQVSIYTNGWRLGGKAASGRDGGGHDRILEHGLHMWMGWYEVAFRTIRACYSEMPGAVDHPFRNWRDAFTPERRITLAEPDLKRRGDASETWTATFPKLPGTPGDAEPFPGEGTVLGRLLALIESNAGPFFRRPSNVTLRTLQTWFRKGGESSIRRMSSNGYWLCALIDLALAAAIGYLTDVLPYGEAGFARINHLDFKDWLLSHGAATQYLWSAPIRALYDLGFAYRDGIVSYENAAAAAGVSLNVLLNAVTGYRDAPLWKMNGGMGDVVFAPLYQVLRQRGARINFFHRLSNLRLSSDGQSIESMAFDRPVKTKAGGYDPLIMVKGMPCWPAEPLWPQIVGGKSANPPAHELESTRSSRRVGTRERLSKRDFDIVVLAIPPSGLPGFGTELLTRGPRIMAMYRAMTCVATRSAQIWLRRGDDHRDGPTITAGLQNPYNSWADMSHLIARENWADETPHSCEYLCGTLPAHQAIGASNSKNGSSRRLREEFLAWANDSQFPFHSRTSRSGRMMRKEIASEYHRVNCDPSDLYVQSFPGSIAHRLRPDESGIANLYFAGDWTATRINSGCVEAAFESGQTAAQAIARRAGCDLSEAR